MPEIAFRFPEIRATLIHVLDELGDPAFQLKEWVEHSSGNAWQSFDEVVHFLFDDTDLASDPSSALGYYLANEREVSAVQAVVSAVDRVLKKYGMSRTDLEYLSSPEWAEVVHSARVALEICKENGCGAYFPRKA
jgi:hypothetical protein